jgi:PTS system beta-glucosides-specific IIC component
VIPLSEVSDPAFAEKMMGEGVAIIPDGGTVFAPFAGVVDTVADTAHAVGLRSDEGIELLIHVGLETVRLKGAAFTLHVGEGQRVEAGAPLLDFDLQAILAAGCDTATPITVINGDAFEVSVASRFAALAAGTAAGAADPAGWPIAPGEPLLIAKKVDV